MAYDLVIKNGVLVDGSGMPRHRADVAVQHGRIVSIGRIRERARGPRRRRHGRGARVRRRPHPHGRPGGHLGRGDGRRRPPGLDDLPRVPRRAVERLVFDPDTIAPEMPEVVHDLPAGARRLVQRARGMAATVVGGEIVLRDGKHTGALSGRLLRGPCARRATM